MKINVALVAGVLVLAGSAPSAQAVDYGRDVKPILAERCYSCHGAIRQKAGPSSRHGGSDQARGRERPCHRARAERREPADRTRDRGCEQLRPHAAAERGGGAWRSRGRHPPRLDRPGSGGPGRGRARRPAPPLGLCSAGAAGGPLPCRTRLVEESHRRLPRGGSPVEGIARQPAREKRPVAAACLPRSGGPAADA